MRGKLLPLLLALCLTLTACGAPSVSDPPDDAAPESQPSVPAFDFRAEDCRCPICWHRPPQITKTA